MSHRAVRERKPQKSRFEICSES